MPGAIAYRTGDLVRRRRDGTLAFLGRLDDQVKLRGHRIELGEIETTLARHPSIVQAVAAVREDSPGDRRLVAYIVPAGTTPSAAELREHVLRALPPYMAPSAFVVLDAMPRTVNGKIDRRGLPAPEGGLELRQVPFMSPRTPVEAVVADIWRDVLAVERVGVYDDFFELGGNSLLLTRVGVRLAHALGVNVPFRRMFELPVLCDLSIELTSRLAEASELGIAPLLDELEEQIGIVGVAR
jgi:hypothetical protein